jgi:phosphoribosylanthranilate isomerase
MIRVKICGMTDSVNIKLVTEAKPDFIGFIFYPGSPRYVGEDPETRLFQNIPDSIKKTGVFINEDNHRVLDLSGRKGLDMIQLHGAESPESCLQLRSSGLIISKVFHISENFNFESLVKYLPVCDYFLFDTKTETHGGSGKKFSWRKLEEYTLDKPFFLSGGIGPDDVDLIKALENRGLYAVDINSRFETSPGIKDTVLVKKFIEKLKLIHNEI